MVKGQEMVLRTVTNAQHGLATWDNLDLFFFVGDESPVGGMALGVLQATLAGVRRHGQSMEDLRMQFLQGSASDVPPPTRP